MNTLNEDILTRYLLGEATPEETACIESWEAQSEENKHTLEQLYFILQATDRLQMMNEVDADKALLNLKKKIKTKKRILHFRKTIQSLQRIAAVLFLPALIFSAYLLVQEYNETQRYINVTTNPGMVSSFELPDGSKVWLNSGGHIKYPAEFSSKRREIELTGQGYFNIKKDESKPFFVKIDPFYSVEVLGTEFNVTAYEDDHLIETTLVTGKVKLNITQKNGKLTQQVLKPNQKAVYDKNTHLLSISTVNPEYDMMWKEGQIIFRKHPMEQVLKVLSRHYNVHFEVTNPQVLQSEITAKFTNEPLPQVLEYLKLASDIKFKIKHPNRIENDSLRVSVIELFK